MTSGTQFGIYLREERRRRGILLWKFAASIPHPQSNIQRMERGKAEPRLGLAVRMVNALGVNVGEFMADLLQKQGWGASPYAQHLEQPQDSFPMQAQPENQAEISNTPAVIFGLLLKEARLARNLNQMKIAEAANYTMRSLISVEKGRQEPMIANALRLVWATGSEPVSFFNAFHRLLQQ